MGYKVVKTFVPLNTRLLVIRVKLFIGVINVQNNKLIGNLCTIYGDIFK